MADLLERLKAALADRYRIDRELGSGGMATVYLAQDLKHERQVAIKVMRPELSAILGGERFLREVRIAAKLNHPHILALHDSGEADEFLYYVMPYVEGESLRTKLNREKQLSLDEAISIIKQVGAALDYAHDQGVIHRDIKPENILIHRGEALVADFGIALALGAASSTRLTDTGLSLGTPEYMSPEQATGGSVDARCDAYALGCVFFELLAGDPPFTGATPQAIMARHLGEPVPSLRILRPSIPAGIEEAVARALAKVPADRLKTAGEFYSLLITAVTDRRQPHLVTVVTWPRTLIKTLAVTALVLIVVTLVMLAVKPGGTPEVRAVQRHTQLTFEGNVQQAVMSPDGEYAAVWSQINGTNLIKVLETDGRSAITIDSSDTLLCCLSWSPDGSQLLYRKGGRSNGRGVLVPRLGGAGRQLRTDVVTAWAPDGARVVSWWPQAKRLWLTDVALGDTTGSIPIGDEHEWVLGVDWSPSGHRLAFATAAGGVVTLKTARDDGGGVHEVLRDSIRMHTPRWAAHNRAIYVARGAEIWKVPVSADGIRDGAPSVLLSGLSIYAYNTSVPAYSVSLDGTRLLYVKWLGYSNLWRFAPDAAGGDDVRARALLTPGTATRYTPRISPDGQRVAFVESVAGTRNLVVMPLDGGEKRQLTFLDGGVWYPAWAPDGKRIVFGSSEGGAPGLWIVDVESGAARALGRNRYDGSGDIAWWPSPHIIYESDDDQEAYLFDPETGEDRLLVRAGEHAWLYEPCPSPDGNSVAFRRTGGEAVRGLTIINVGDTLLQEVHPAITSPVGWSADGSAVLAMRVDNRSSEAREIFLVPVNGQEARPFLTFPPLYSGNPINMSITPDGKRLVAAVFNSSQDVWIVDNFDPGRE